MLHEHLGRHKFYVGVTSAHIDPGDMVTQALRIGYMETERFNGLAQRAYYTQLTPHDVRIPLCQNVPVRPDRVIAGDSARTTVNTNTKKSNSRVSFTVVTCAKRAVPQANNGIKYAVHEGTRIG